VESGELAGGVVVALEFGGCGAEGQRTQGRKTEGLAMSIQQRIAHYLPQASDMWKRGELGSDIARVLGVTPRQMYHVVERNRDLFPIRDYRHRGGPIPLRDATEISKPLDDEQRARLAEMWIGGIPIREMAARLGITTYRVEREGQLRPDIFPKRTSRKSKYGEKAESSQAIVIVEEKRPRQIKEGCMEFKNPKTGYVCTMPLVSILMRRAA
jgi:hypothetical protein